MTLPDKDALLAACRGFPRHDHPLLQAASELAALHQQRIHSHATTTVNEIDWRRAQVMIRIDRWVAARAPSPSGGARLHTETIGRIVDRIAQLCVHAYSRLASPSNGAYADASAALFELTTGYEDLVAEIMRGIRKLPESFDQW
ncbi:MULTISPECIES: DUF4254 domain-containing protein [unclassified Nocardia]|uniref:DUF4254 domain-containing protein n=1 Tax=unclassified Nocardia TaxID=2637762 RepID=UPI00278C8295|nr:MULTISPECIES: DUF4254 domain-containing protein [unclassified Nocardia]